MKKYLVMAFMVAFSAFGFSSCGDDDESEEIKIEEGASVKALNALKPNHVTFGPLANLEVESDAWYSGDEVSVYVRYYNLEKREGMGLTATINKSVLGKEINLANPHGISSPFSIECQLFEITPDGFPTMDYGGALFYRYDGSKITDCTYTYHIFGTSCEPSYYEDPKSCFKEGTLKLEAKGDGIHMTLNGTLQSDLIVAFKSFVATDKVSRYDR